MYTAMDWWTKIRLEVLREESSKREILRREGIRWETLKKILKHSEPPGYRLKEPRPEPKMGPYLDRLTHRCHWKPMGKVTDCDRPGNDLTRHHRHGRTQSRNNAKNGRITSLTKKLKLMYL